MFGAILGNIVGSPYEFDRGEKVKSFDFFNPRCRFTDDSVMTLAIADALMTVGKDADVETIKKAVVASMQDYGRRYPKAGYGGMFRRWLQDPDPKPYHSFGNGAAMRISAVGWMYDSLERIEEVAVAVTEVTHDHPEGIRGALAVVSAIFLARKGLTLFDIRDFIIRELDYDLSRTVDEIRPDYKMDETCQGCIPEALTCFFESRSYEDAIRNAVSIGGDTDTIACIVGGMAEAYYGMPEGWTKKVKSYLPAELCGVLEKFEKVYYPAETSDYMKARRLRWQTNWKTNEPVPGVDLGAYWVLTQEGVTKGWPEALELEAYASYTGTSLFPVDYVKSRNDLLRLIEGAEHPAPEWYNTLGYIFYYGRTNDGKPEYEKALQYFTVAASFGLFEASYKIADMLAAGQGVPKNTDAAARIVEDLYSENRRRFEDQVFDGKFADVALRMGGLYENGYGVLRDPVSALSYYMQAKLAIENRKPFNEFGDEKVARKIEEGLERVKRSLPPDFFLESLTAPVPFLLNEILESSYGMDIAVFTKEGETYLLCALAPEEGEARKHLFTVPELSLCALTNSIILKLEEAKNIRMPSREKHFYINGLEYDPEKEEWQFLYGDTPMLLFQCSGFTLAK